MIEETLSKIQNAIIAYCIAVGDEPPKPFDELPELHRNGMRVSFLRTVEAFESGYGIHDINELAERSHESWLYLRKADGWKYGETLDREKKTHPALVEWDDLDHINKTKGLIFTTAAFRFKDRQ